MHDEDIELYLEYIENYKSRPEQAERHLLQAIQHGGGYQVTRRLAEPYLKWAAQIAVTFYEHHTDAGFGLARVIQAANTGLILAAMRYKPDDHYNFKGYAKYYIDEELKRLLRTK